MVVRLLPKQEARVRFPHPAPIYMTQEIFKYTLRDKAALALLSALIVFSLISVVLILFWIQPSSVQIPIRFSGYENSLYNAQWYERLGFILFLLFQTASAAVLSMLMNARGYRILAHSTLVVSIFVILITTITAWAVTQTVSL